jgi:PAS domain S-box-containing protein
MALLAATLASLLRWELRDLFSHSFQFIPLSAVVLVTLLGGSGPGILTLALSILSSVAWFLASPQTNDTAAGEAIETGLFCAGSGLVVLVITMLQRSRRREHEARVQRIEAESRQRHATAMLETERRFSGLVQAVPSLTFEADPEGRNTFASDQWYAYTGLTPEETVGWGWARALPPEDVEPVKKRWGEAVRSGKLFENRGRLRGSDGSYRWFLFRALPTRDTEGRIVHWTGSLTDIDDLVRTEEALRASEEFSRGLFASSYDCIKVLDLDGNLLSMGEGGRRTLEIDDVGPYLHKPYLNFWAEKDHPKVAQAVAAARAGGVGEFVGYSPSVTGKPRWWDARITSVPGRDGRPERLLVVARDITETRDAQERLRLSEERLSLANEAGGIGTYDADLRTGRTVYSPELCKILGAPVGHMDMPETRGWQFVHPEDRAQVEAAIARAAEPGGPGIARLELRIVRPSGEIRWISWSGLTFFEVSPAGRIPIRSIGACIDITERKSAEDALRENEECFRAFFDHAAVGAVQVDTKGRYTQVNDRFCRITGYSREELLRLSPRDLVHPQDRELDWAQYRRLLTGEAAGYEAEKRYVRKDGTAIWVQVTAGLVRDGQGRPLRSANIVQDISERKAAEEALRESEGKFRSLSESIGAAVGMVQNTRFIYANPYMAEMLGYTVEELLSLHFPRLVRPDYRRKMLDLARRRQAGEPVPSHYEFPAVTKSGEERWVDFWPARTIYKGKPAIVGAGFDITQRKQMETALRESEEKFRMLAENAKVLIGILRDRRLLYVNPCLVELSGYTREELLSMDVAALIRQDERELVMDRACRRQRGEPLETTYEYPMVDKFGEVLWIQMWPVHIKYQGADAVIATGIDVTERRHIEETLRGRTQSLRLLSDTATQLLMAEHPEDVLRRIFEELAHDLDVEICVNYFVSADKPGIRLNFCTGVDDVSRGRISFLRFGEGVCGTVAQTGNHMVIEDLQHSSDPRTAILRELELKVYACYPIKVHGRTVATLAFGTRRRSHFAAEELDLLRAVADQVALALERQELVGQLQKRAEELTRANQAKDKFLAILSHELRTPLTPVLATVSMLQEERAEDEEMRDSLEVIRRNIELEARLIDDLLDLTRIARGKITLNKSRVELCTVIRRAVEVCRADIDARQLHFGVQTCPSVPYWVNADVGRLQQVFWNLIKNAIKFTPHGGCVGIRFAPTPDGFVTAEVTDSGEGIEPEALGRIFDAFEQAEPAHRQQFGGLGLGLAISKALVEMHGGAIEADSAGKGKGATFRVRLPTVQPPVTSRRTIPSATHEPAGHPLHILLVEDHGDTARIWKRLLERRGHDVQTAGDVETALSLASDELDLVISDLGLPDASGLDLIRRLHDRRPDLKGIALSGYGMESDVQRSLEAGFAEHLTKPVDPQTLQAAIARVAGAS